MYEDCRPLIERLTQLLQAEHGQYHLNFKWLPYAQTIRALFADCPDMSLFNNNLATVLQALGVEANLRQAQALLQQAYATFQALMGERHYYTQTVRNNLFALYVQIRAGKPIEQCTEEELFFCLLGFEAWLKR